MSDNLTNNNSGISGKYRFRASVQNYDLVIVRGCTEFEPEWFQVLRDIYWKSILPVGQFPTTRLVGGEENDMWRWMKEWLDKRACGSVVYMAFRSEAKRK